jgi:hypothetical protein
MEKARRPRRCVTDRTPSTIGPERIAKLLADVKRRGKRTRSELSPLAAVLDQYLQGHPGAVAAYPRWLASTLQAFGFYPERVAPDEIAVAFEELGGLDYRTRMLELSRVDERLRDAVRGPRGSVRRASPELRQAAEEEGGFLLEDGLETEPLSLSDSAPSVTTESHVLVPVEAATQPEPWDEGRDHSLACECVRCASPEPRYARPWRA